MAQPISDPTNKSSGMNSEFKNKMTPTSELHSYEKMAHDAGEKIGNFATNFSKSTADSVKSSREYIQDNPIKGVAIAAAVGVATGSLLTMALRRRRD